MYRPPTDLSLLVEVVGDLQQHHVAFSPHHCLSFDFASPFFFCHRLFHLNQDLQTRRLLLLPLLSQLDDYLLYSGHDNLFEEQVAVFPIRYLLLKQDSPFQHLLVRLMITIYEFHDNCFELPHIEAHISKGKGKT